MNSLNRIDDQSMSVKAHLIGINGRHEVRRFGIAESLATNFSVLKEKVSTVFSIKNEDIVISWKDSEGDHVTISTDEELVEAIADSLSKQKLQVFHIYVSTNDNAKQGNQDGDRHEGVTCNSCGGCVFGFHYKCMTCYDFDLCGSCENKGIQKEHRMTRIPKVKAMLRAKGAPKLWGKELEVEGARGLFPPRLGVNRGMGINNGCSGWQPWMEHVFRHCNRNGVQEHGGWRWRGKNCGGVGGNTEGGCWRIQDQTAGGCPHKRQQQKQENQQVKAQKNEQQNQSSNDQQIPTSNTSSDPCPFYSEGNAPEQVADAIKGFFTALSGQHYLLFEIVSALSGQQPHGFGEASYNQEIQHKKPQEKEQQNLRSDDLETPSNNSSNGSCPFLSKDKVHEQVAEVIKGIFTGLSGQKSPIFEILTGLSGHQPHGFGATSYSKESQYKKSHQKEQQNQSSYDKKSPSINTSSGPCPCFSEDKAADQVAESIKGIFTALSEQQSPLCDILTALSTQQPSRFDPTSCINNSKASSTSNDNENKKFESSKTQYHHLRQCHNEGGECDVANISNQLDCDSTDDNNTIRQCCYQDEDDIQSIQSLTSKTPSAPNPLLEAQTREDMPVDTEFRNEMEFNNMVETETELKSDAEEWTMVNGDERTVEARLYGGAKPKNPPSQKKVLYPHPDLRELRTHPDTKIQQALEQMQAMGYHNEGGWLTNILEMKQGDINQVLDMLQPLNK